MHDELTVKIGSKDHKAFLQGGFYSSFVQRTPLHKHNYAEVHIVAGDAVEFQVGDSLYSSADGNLVIIPSGIYHCVTGKTSEVRHTAFQVDYCANAFAMQKLSWQTAMDFMNEIEKCRTTNDYATVSAYISLFCSCLCPEELRIRPVNDYSFLIREFFSKHYHEDLHLSALADVLHLSQRQTERLVIQTTGHTFREELAAVRINVAKHLLKTTDLSLDEVSRYVGYHSYAGFWKAMKKQERP